MVNHNGTKIAQLLLFSGFSLCLIDSHNSILYSIENLDVLRTPL